MARYADIYLAVFMINIGLSVLGSIPFYYVAGQALSIGAGVHYAANPSATPNTVLNTVGCSLASNVSLACSPPSFLANPSFFTGAVFGWIYGGLVALSSMVFAPYYVYNLVLSFTDYVPFAVLITSGLAILYYYFWLLVLTGRYFESA
jgi:hypothetical protein